eukprot:TRINITY_DN5090_c0_g1_i2.p1 TRINITY_DN5090_c0_g1~~TRINITY_DN5090_c0_g1_i2.p1  ORF type:complete len:469 (+),score=38.03 TRINITY_DN5090_c0_g1_i2:594-2000(+)
MGIASTFSITLTGIFRPLFCNDFPKHWSIQPEHLCDRLSKRTWRRQIGDFVTARRMSGLFSYDAWLSLQLDPASFESSDVISTWDATQKGDLRDLRLAFLRARVSENLREHYRFVAQRESALLLPKKHEIEDYIEQTRCSANPHIASAILKWAGHKASVASPLPVLTEFNDLSKSDKIDCVRHILLILSLSLWLRDPVFLRRFKDCASENLGTLSSECLLLSIQALCTGQVPEEETVASDQDSWCARVRRYRTDVPYANPLAPLRGGVDWKQTKLPPVRSMHIPSWQDISTSHPQIQDGVVEFVIGALPELLSPTQHFRDVIGKATGMVESQQMLTDIFVHVSLNHIKDHLSLAALISTSKNLRFAIENSGAWSALLEKSWSKERLDAVLGEENAPKDEKAKFKKMYLEYDKSSCGHCGEKHKVMSDYEWYSIIDSACRSEEEYEEKCPCDNCEAEGSVCPQRSRFVL